MKKLLNEKPEMVFWIILLIQIAFIIFWGGMKSNFHQDELYSFESAHYAGNTTPYNCYMHESELFSEKTWLSVKEFKPLLTVDSSTSVLNDGPIEIAKQFIKGYPHDTVLNICMGLFTPGYVSKWPGIALNIVFFIVSQWFLYKLTYVLCNDNKIALATVLIYGLSSISLSHAIYTRFYSYVIMNILIAFYLHYLLWKTDKIWKIVVYDGVSYALLYIAYRGSQLAAVLLACLFVSFTVALIIKKKFKTLIIYLLPVIAGAVYLRDTIIHYVTVLFNPTAFMSGDGEPLDLMMKNATHLGKRILLGRCGDYLGYLGKGLFGHVAILIAVITLLIVLLVVNIRAKKLGRESNPDTDKSKNVIDVDNQVYMYILATCCILFSIFGVIVGLWQIRYYSLIYPLILIVIMVVYNKMAVNRIVFQYIFYSLFAIGIIYTNVTVNIDNVFLEDKPTLARVKEYGTMDNVIWNLYDFQIILECVYHENEDSRFYVCSEEETLEYNDFNDEFLLWINEDDEVSEEELDYMNDCGYDVVEDLGIAADARIYYCKRME